MPQVTLSKIDKHSDGRISVRFGKVVREFASIEHMRGCVRSALTQDDLIDMALALLLSRQPNLGNPAAMEGRTVSIDFNSTSWGTVG
jgi:hypothetical protein